MRHFSELVMKNLVSQVIIHIFSGSSIQVRVLIIINNQGRSGGMDWSPSSVVRRFTSR